MSGLSAITIDSTTKVVQVTRPTVKVEPLRTNEEAGTSKNKFETIPKTDFDDSLSSLSIESEDETNLLTQAIAAGFCKTKESNPINIPPSKQRQDVANESISSVDSCDKDDATNSILEQCIQSGIAKVAKKDSSNKRPLMTSSPKKSMLPTFRPNSAVAPKKKSDDEDILKECIASGMMKTTKHSTSLIQNMAQLSITDPKNAETTSATVQEEHNNVPHASVTGKLEFIFIFMKIIKKECFFIFRRRQQRPTHRKDQLEEPSRERPNSRRKYRFRKRTFSPSNLDNAKWV
jgi:hypothetical protein